MKLLYRSLTLLFNVVLMCGMVSAQEDNTVDVPVKVSVPTVSLVSFAGSNARLSYTKGKGAEQIITPSTVDTTWINYTCVVSGNSTNTICVNINSGNLPAEVAIKLDVGAYVGAGAGKMGKSVGRITLSEYPQAIITNIGTCYTGQGFQNGHPLIYSWEWKPSSDTEQTEMDNNIQVSVIYTLTAGK